MMEKKMDFIAVAMMCEDPKDHKFINLLKIFFSKTKMKQRRGK